MNVLRRWCLLVAAAAAAAGPAGVWSQGFVPASASEGWRLSEVLARAAANHPLVEAAEARVGAARGARRTAGAFPNPVFTYQSENGAFPGGSAPANIDRETSIFATLPLEPLFQRAPRVRRAEQEVQAAQAAAVGARRQVALHAARAFHRVALAQASVGAAADIAEPLEALAAYTRSRVKEGVGAEGDLVRVEVELARAATTAALEQVELARARAELQPYLQTPRAPAPALESLVVRAEGAVTAPSSPPPLEALLARPREGRPDLLTGRARAAATRAEVALQQALLVRQLGVLLGTKRVAGANTLLAGVSLPLPLFDQNGGERQRARGEQTAAEQELAWVERTAEAEVTGAYRAVELLGTQVTRLRDSLLPRAGEARRITLAAYEEGAASLLQVLDASRTLADARITYYRTLFAYRQSILELQVAAGLEPEATADTWAPRPPATAPRRDREAP